MGRDTNSLAALLRPTAFAREGIEAVDHEAIGLAVNTLVEQYRSHPVAQYGFNTLSKLSHGVGTTLYWYPVADWGLGETQTLYVRPAIENTGTGSATITVEWWEMGGASAAGSATATTTRSGDWTPAISLAISTTSEYFELRFKISASTFTDTRVDSITALWSRNRAALPAGPYGDLVPIETSALDADRPLSVARSLDIARALRWLYTRPQQVVSAANAWYYDAIPGNARITIPRISTIDGRDLTLRLLARAWDSGTFGASCPWDSGSMSITTSSIPGFDLTIPSRREGDPPSTFVLALDSPVLKSLSVWWREQTYG